MNPKAVFAKSFKKTTCQGGGLYGFISFMTIFDLAIADDFVNAQAIAAAAASAAAAG